MTINEEIKLINNIIKNAEMNGADIGGTYRSNEEGLIIAIQAWLIARDLIGKYDIKEVRYDDGWSVYQIVENGD